MSKVTSTYCLILSCQGPEYHNIAWYHRQLLTNMEHRLYVETDKRYLDIYFALTGKYVVPIVSILKKIDLVIYNRIGLSFDSFFMIWGPFQKCLCALKLKCSLIFIIQ